MANSIIRVRDLCFLPHIEEEGRCYDSVDVLVTGLGMIGHRRAEELASIHVEHELRHQFDEIIDEFELDDCPF